MSINTRMIRKTRMSPAFTSGGQHGYDETKEDEATLIERPGEYTYYDVVIPHNDFIQNSGSPTPANFFQVRAEPLFSGKPSDYNMSIVRFTVPTQIIPIQIFPVRPVPNTLINLSPYSVTLKFGAFTRQEYIIWNPEDLTAPVPPSPNLSLNYINSKYWQYYALYSYQHFARLINTALAAATVAIIGDGAPATGPPFITYSGITNLFTLNAPAAFLNTAATPIEIYFNQALSTNFTNSMDFTRYSYADPFSAGAEVRLNVFDKVTNSVTLAAPYGLTYIMEQEFNALANMASFTSLIVTSSSLPVRSEWISRQNVLGDPGANTAIGDNSFKILADFEVLLENGLEVRRFVHYLPTAEYRRISLISDTPITSIDIQIYWKDQFDNLYEVLIPSHDVATIKILFEKK